MNRSVQMRSMLRFLIPLTAEFVTSVIIQMLFNAVIGTISSSSLTAISTANLTVTVYHGLFSLISAGATILTAQLKGAGDVRGTSRVIEQVLLLTVLFSLIFTIGSYLLAEPIMRLQIRNGDAGLLREAAGYFRLLTIGFLPMFVYTIITCVERAIGRTGAALFNTSLVNAFQLGCAWLLVSVFGLGINGAGWSMVICRLIGGISSLVVVCREHAIFVIDLKRILRPDRGIIRRILRLGVPVSAESTFVQFGYLIANSLTVKLGTSSATIYQIANSLQSFSNTICSIGSSVAASFVGQRIGAGEPGSAKRFGYRNFLVCSAGIHILYLLTALLGVPLARFYTTDPSMIREVSACLWLLMLYALPAISINTIDPSLRAGGDVSFVMAETMIGVWLVRLPLSWLFAHRMNMGIRGIYLANIVSLYIRAGMGQIRFAGSKWIRRRI